MYENIFSWSLWYSIHTVLRQDLLCGLARGGSVHLCHRCPSFQLGFWQGERYTSDITTCFPWLLRVLLDLPRLSRHWSHLCWSKACVSDLQLSVTEMRSLESGLKGNWFKRGKSRTFIEESQSPNYPVTLPVRAVHCVSGGEISWEVCCEALLRQHDDQSRRWNV